jgi:quercetin dioxygenase-like cupin family protein
MEHPRVIQPATLAEWRADKMGKTTIFESPRLLVGLNAFEPGQSHALHAHAGMDKVYQVLEGEGQFLLEGRELPMRAGDLLVAPDGVPHGVRNSGAARLLVLAILSPAPRSAGSSRPGPARPIPAAPRGSPGRPGA